jgi:hypothetical protein
MDAHRTRLVAAGAAAGSAILYYLIGLGVLNIGESTTGADPDLLGFGLTTGSAFVGFAILVLLVRRRWLLALLGLFDAAVIVGYFGFAWLREPQFEVWGLAIKALEGVALVAIGALVFGHREARRTAGTLAVGGTSS